MKRTSNEQGTASWSSTTRLFNEHAAVYDVHKLRINDQARACFKLVWKHANAAKKLVEDVLLADSAYVKRLKLEQIGLFEMPKQSRNL